MGGRRSAQSALAAACALACLVFQPLQAHAATPVRGRPLASINHPPVDAVTSFDNGSRSDNRVALSFDADLTPGMLQQLRSGAVRSWYNQEVRQILDSEQVPATIFMTGLWADTYPEVARELASDPLFEIGNHTHDHAAFRTPCYGLGGAVDRAGEIAQAQREIAAATGVTPRLLRFPGDCYDRSDQQLAGAAGLAVISGDVRGGDAFNQSAVSVASTVLRALQPGSIVILHLHGGPNAPMTAPALRMVIQAVRERGLRFTKVSTLLGLAAEPARVAPPSAAQLLAALRRPDMNPPHPAAGSLERFRRPLSRPWAGAPHPWRRLLT